MYQQLSAIAWKNVFIYQYLNWYLNTCIWIKIDKYSRFLWRIIQQHIFFSCTQETYIEFMPGNPSLMELIYIACLIYGDMREASDNAVTSIYILLNWPYTD